MLSECKSVDEALSIRDKAAALEAYFKSQKKSEAAQNDYAEVKLRAERCLGKLINGMEKHPGGRPRKTGNTVLPVSAYRTLGIEKMSASRWMEEASVPPERFEKYIETERAKKAPELTRKGVLALAREVGRVETLSDIAEKAKKLEPLNGVTPCPVIYADPPWEYGNTAGASAVADEYPTMSLEEICALPVPATPDAVLFLWATSPLLPEAMRVIEAWGFSYKGSMIWDKGMGTGNWVLNCHELLLIAVRGKMPCPAPENRPKSVIQAARGRHSEKPDEFAEAIRAMYPQFTEKQRFEMFARKPRDGFTVWGNQAA
jgi:N6-adenosine-specific RNA methylase IME4